MFSNDKVVLSLFDSGADADKAVQALAEHDFGDEVQVFDRGRMKGETPVDEPSVVASPAVEIGSGGSVIHTPDVDTEENAAGSEETALTAEMHDKLTRLGVGKEEATFYARRVAGGSVLVVVETDRIKEAQEVLESMSGRVTVEN